MSNCCCENPSDFILSSSPTLLITLGNITTLIGPHVHAPLGSCFQTQVKGSKEQSSVYAAAIGLPILSRCTGMSVKHPNKECTEKGRSGTPNGNKRTERHDGHRQKCSATNAGQPTCGYFSLNYLLIYSQQSS